MLRQQDAGAGQAGMQAADGADAAGTPWDHSLVRPDPVQTMVLRTRMPCDARCLDVWVSLRPSPLPARQVAQLLTAGTQTCTTTQGVIWMPVGGRQGGWMEERAGLDA
eukprot:658697-Rhodomonas_salina.1